MSSPARQRLSAADAAWLHMDRPTNLMVINAVLLLERPLDWERLAAVVRGRLRELKARMDAIKRSPEGPVSYAVLEAVGLTPPALESRIVDLFTAKASAVMTNVPGPRQPVHLAGAPLRAVIVWAPTAGSVGMSVSIFSYRGEVTIGLLTHARLVPNPQAILATLPRELAALERLAPAGAPRARSAIP